MKIILFALLFLGVLLFGCTEAEEKEFMNAIVKDAVDQANPFHSKPSKPTPTPLHIGYDDRQACSEVGESYVCQNGAIYRSKCDGVWEWKEYVGLTLETCNGYYQKLSCNGYTLVDTGSIDEQTYCLAGGLQLGKTYLLRDRAYDAI